MNYPVSNMPHHIIAIGASAGGLEELNSFFDHTPLDSVSYVIVQHLSADFKSRMVELLGRHSKLIVQEAENGMPVQANKVYLIPNNKFMTIRNDRLYLTDKEDEIGPRLTINRFFQSLAANSGKKAIGVILSGLGSDGTEGIRSIKKMGGMVIARNPETTEFGSMPSNAIATGLVDFILEPAAMPATIQDYVQQETEPSVEDQNDTKNVAIITNLIKAQLPLDFSDYKQSTILRRIKRRAEFNNFSTLEPYIEFLKTTPEEIEALAQDFLISVTQFFRDKEAFDFLQSDIIPGIIEKARPDEELKLWVSGCATGEEAYSLAILIAEQLPEALKNTVVKIFATDIDRAALAHAGKGVYTAAISKDVSVERLDKYFTKEGDTYQVKPSLRKMVIFAHHDLIKNPPFCNMQLISCRNLLIYLTPALQKKVFALLLFGLKMDGYLFLGSSENPPPPTVQNMETLSKKWKVYRNRETKRFVSFDAFSLPMLYDKKQTNPFISREDTALTIADTLADTLNETLVSDLDYLAVCIDEKNNVVKSYGDTTRFLLQKNFTSNLSDLLPRPLAIAFNTLYAAVAKTGEKASLKGIKTETEKGLIQVNLSVTGLSTKRDTQKLMLVTFKEEAASMASVVGEAFDEKTLVNQYTSNLEQEVKELKEKLRTAQLQLDTSNENLQSFNEELLSANEEMQSTNEEMQSVNEELHTINADYQLKNKELQELNDALNNYFRSNINGQLVVDNELRLTKFSPGIIKQINLLPTDIGRPLSHITTKFKFETLQQDITQVLADGVIINREIETGNGNWYHVMTMPYLQTADKKRIGAIVTFNDITELKKTQRELDKKNESLLRVNADLENFVNTASHDLIAPLGNIEMSIGMMNQIQVTDPKLSQLLTIINSSVKKFRGLVNDISTISKIESDMLSLELVDVEEIISNVEWSLENKIQTSEAVIVRNLQVKHILFSKKNLRSIVYNLLSNSIKFKGPEAPIVSIQTAKQGDDIVLTVQDNGIGMHKKDLNTIFELHGRLQQQVEGQGIGLYLAKKIVDAAGGNILVHSEPGKGSTFCIYFKARMDKVLPPVLVNNVAFIPAE